MWYPKIAKGVLAVSAGVLLLLGLHALPRRSVFAQSPDAPPPDSTPAPAPTDVPLDQSGTPAPDAIPPAESNPENIEATPEGTPPQESPAPSGEAADLQPVNETEPATASSPQDADAIPVTTEAPTEEVVSPEVQPAEQAPAEVVEPVASDNVSINSEAVPTEVTEKSGIEDQQITAATEDADRASLLLGFANDKVDDLSDQIKAEQFGGANFLAQRLDEQVSAFVDIFDTLSSSAQAKLGAKFDDFRDGADTALRAQQLTVPEGLEQDFEIIRGKLFTNERAIP